MGFNWLYVNPIHEPGVSGSLYAIKHYDRVHPAFRPKGSLDARLSCLEPTVHQVVSCGLAPMMDLVINHTAIDSPLVDQHPEWFVRDQEGRVAHPFAVDPNDPARKTVWGDLAEIDNRRSSDREGLWEYWGRVLDAYLSIGIKGFRCDAAYKVPVELWQFLIARARQQRPDVLFWAENLGCTPEETRALRSAGFQFVCNSSKWWNFSDEWCLDQHEEFKDLPSIAFPETHDTQRMARESGGREDIQRQRYVLAAVFSSGLMMPIGYEFGFQESLHVVQTSPADWEVPHWDLQPFIRAVNQWKLADPLWQGEGTLCRRFVEYPHLCLLERRSLGSPGRWGLICVHLGQDQACEVDCHRFGTLPAMPELTRLSYLDRSPDPLPLPSRVRLSPSEIVVIS